VLPPDLRPLVPLGNGRFATFDLNDLYRRIVDRSNRLRRLIELDAPDAIRRNESWVLQCAVASVVQNGRFADPVLFQDRRLLSLADHVAGHRGRFATNLLSKRVDYSAVAPAVARANLAPSRACVPRELALELWRPWIYRSLEQHGAVTTLKAARRLLLARDPAVMDAIADLVRSHPVILLPERDAAVAISVDVELWDERAIALAPHAIRTLGLAPGHNVTLHVPCDPRAIDESRRCLRGVHLSREPEAETTWIARASRAGVEDIGAVLFDAALRRERDPAAGPIARMVLGRMP
jgi:DNA-directed RNA polymerase subunit beta'